MLKAIIFDMDGTLTEPHINWPVLRAAIACPPGKTIIEHIESLPPDLSARANRILLDTEREAAEQAGIADGAKDLLDALRGRGLKLALVTNNHREAMHTILQRGNLCFEIALSRDDGRLKPAPDLIHLALDHLSVSPGETIGIGDGRYDILACEAADVRCIYLTHGKPAFDHEPSIAALDALLSVLEKL